MMGPKQEAQAALFYEFSLDAHVPQDHLLRSIDRFVDLSSIRAHLAGFYSHTGRPSVDPVVLIRMLLGGYCFGIRSERRLCEDVHLNLAYRWFCRLDLADRIPDHSTFSKNRPSRQIASQSPAGQCMGVSGRVSCFGTCSKRPLPAALKKVSPAGSVWRWMPA
jgi:transposase